MSYTQFGYTAFPSTSQLMVGTSGSTGTTGSSCCDSGRASAAAADTQTAVCSLPATYDSRLLSTYPRLATSGLYSGSPYGDQPYPNFSGVDSSAFYPSLSSAYGMKDAADPWRGIAPSASYYYDPSLAAYGYGGLDFNGARRKNVTRDSTSTLKAWLNEHRKNPYPTKGEKIMLAIITKMTLTQVSTWFANARRRLKKENKMTWEPRNKMDADDVKDYEDEDDDDKGDRNNNNNNNSNNAGNNNNNTSNNNSGNNGHQTSDDREDNTSRCADEDMRTGASIRRETLPIVVGCGGRGDSGEETDDGDSQMTPGGTSEDDPHYPPERVSGGGGGGSYHLLRHHATLSDSISRGSLTHCGSNDRHSHHPHESSLLATDFTPSDSSSPALPDIQTLIRSPGAVSMETKGGSVLSVVLTTSPTSNASTTSSATSGVDPGDPTGQHHVKPKIWSLADTATSKSPVPSSGGGGFPDVNGAGTTADMLGHCGWFSVNPYQVSGSPSSLGSLVGSPNYPPSFASPSTNSGVFGSIAGSAGGAAAATSAYSGVSHGFSPIPPQTDTPPQTPPNMKVSTGLPLSVGSASYLAGQTAHLYLGQAAGTGVCAGSSLSAMQVGKNGGIYPMSHMTSSTRSMSVYRSEALPEDFSTAAHFRSASIQ